jgi:hypothetical protein
MNPNSRIQAILAVAACAALARTGAAQCHVERLSDPSAASGDNFAQSVALSGGRAFVGAPYAYAAGGPTGVVLAFDSAGASWGAGVPVLADDLHVTDRFGYAVAAQGSRLVAGANAAHDGAFGSGSAYVFDFVGGAWVQSGKLSSSTPASTGGFGSAVALDGDRCVIGAWTENGNRGAAHVFELAAGVWSEVAVLTGSDSAAQDLFGATLALDGDVIAVGAQGHELSQVNAGATYVFERSGAGAWLQTAKLVAPDPVASAWMGAAVATCPGRIAVGAPGAPGVAGNSGKVYVFERVAGNWALDAAVTPPQGRPVDQFGTSVALRGEWMLVGAPIDDTTIQDSGSAQLFQKQAGVWVPTRKFGSTQAPAPTRFGHSVALDDATALVGAIYDVPSPQATGAAYAFGLDDSVIRYCTSSANSYGNGVWMSTAGSTSIGAGDYRLVAEGVPPHKYGTFFYAPQQAAFPLGNGTLCLAGGGVGLFRLPSFQADGQGNAAQLVDFTQPPAGGSGAGAIRPGSTWNFQFWYRDPNVGAGSNLSDALHVTFCP